MKKSTLTISLIVATTIIIILIIFILYYRKSPENYNSSDIGSKKSSDDVILETPVAPLQSGKPSLVLFYAEWCGASKSMMPAWEEIVNKMRGGPIDIITFEHKTHPNEMKENNIQAFPTIRLYPEGYPSQNFINYSGADRSAESIYNFATSSLR